MLLFVKVFTTAHEALKKKDAENVAPSASIAGDAFGSSGSSSGSTPRQSYPSSLPEAPEAPSPEEATEKALWTELGELDVEQLTAVLEDANAVLFADGTLKDWLGWKRKSRPNASSYNFMTPNGSSDDTNVFARMIPANKQWRRFVPEYSDIVDTVNDCMDETADPKVVREWDTRGWQRKGRKVSSFVGGVRWWGGMCLAMFELALVITPVVLDLELSSWARYNLWAYLVLHSAAFFKALWMLLSFTILGKEGSAWNGDFAETDLLLVSIAVLVRKRNQHPNLFPHLSLLDLLRDARCVYARGTEKMGLAMALGECPHGTGSAENGSFGFERQTITIKLAPTPESSPPGPETSRMKPCTFTLSPVLTCEPSHSLTPTPNTSHQVGAADSFGERDRGPGRPDQGGGSLSLHPPPPLSLAHTHTHSLLALSPFSTPLICSGNPKPET